MTSHQLPPEDLPSGPGLVPAPAGDAVADVLAHNTPGGPWVAAAAFLEVLTDSGGTRAGVLREMVTPESRGAWGDFAAARELLTGTAMLSRASSPAPGVAYVRFVSDPGQPMMADGPTMIMARAVATLQFRPDSGRWLVHALGDYVRPEDLPALPDGGSPN